MAAGHDFGSAGNTKTISCGVYDARRLVATPSGLMGVGLTRTQRCSLG